MQLSATGVESITREMRNDLYAPEIIRFFYAWSHTDLLFKCSGQAGNLMSQELMREDEDEGS